MAFPYILDNRDGSLSVANTLRRLLARGQWADFAIRPRDRQRIIARFAPQSSRMCDRRLAQEIRLLQKQ